MEHSLGLMQLKTVLNRISSPEEDPSKYVKIKAILDKFVEERNQLLWYLVLCAEGKHRNDILDDPVVDFIMCDSNPIPVDDIVKIIADNHDFLHDMIGNGPIGVTLPFIKFYLNNHCTGQPNGTLCVKCQECIPSAVLFKIGSLDAGENVANLAEVFCSSMVKTQKTLEKSWKTDNWDYETAFVTLYSPLGHAIQAIQINYGDFLQFKNNKEQCLQYNLSHEYNEINEGSGLVQKYNVMVATLKLVNELLRSISICLWLELAEIASDFETATNMQTAIGNRIFELNELIDTYDVNIGADFRECLNQLQIKPLSEDDILAMSDWRDIILQILNNHENELQRKKQFIAVLTRSEPWQCEEGLRFIFSHYHLDPTSSIVIKCLDIIYDEPTMELKNAYRTMFLTSFKEFEPSLQVEFLDSVVNHKAYQSLRSVEIPELTFVLNQLSTVSDFNQTLKDVIVLAIQNPRIVVEQLILYAVTSSESLLICMEVLRGIQPLVLNKKGDIQPDIRNSLKDILNKKHSDKDWPNAVLFFDNFTNKWPKTNEYICQLILETINEQLVNEQWENVPRLLGILEVTLNNCNDSVIAFASCMCAQILRQSCWDSQSFRMKNVSLYGAGLKFLNVIRSCSHHSGDYCKRFILTLPEPIRSNFFYLWEVEEDYPDCEELYIQILLHMRNGTAWKVEHFDRNSHIISLMQIIPHLHISEWLQLFATYKNLYTSTGTADSGEEAFIILTDAVKILAVCCDNSMYPCFEYCMSCLTEVFNSIDDHSGNIFPNLLAPLNEINCVEVKDRCYLIMVPVLGKYLKSNCGRGDLLKLVPAIWRDKLCSIIHRD